MRTRTCSIAVISLLISLTTLVQSQTSNSVPTSEPALLSALSSHQPLAMNLIADASTTAVNRQPPTAATVWPSAYTPGIIGYNSPTYAYDNNLSTASGQTEGDCVGAVSASETWYGFPAAHSGASDVQLNVNSYGEGSGTGGGGGTVSLSYSLDGGNTFSSIYFIAARGTHSQQWNAVSLSPTQDLTKVRVKGLIEAIGANGDGCGSATQSIYEINITYTY